MASKEEILRTVLTALDRLVAIEERLVRIEYQVTPTLTIEPSGCPECSHACGGALLCPKFCRAVGCLCKHPYHRAYKTPLTD